MSMNVAGTLSSSQPSQDDPGYAKWMEMDGEATATTAKEMMDILKEHFEPSAAILVLQSSRAFYGGMKLKQGGDVVEHLGEMQRHRRILSESGQIIRDQEMNHQVRVSLPKFLGQPLGVFLLRTYAEFKAALLDAYYDQRGSYQ